MKNVFFFLSVVSAVVGGLMVGEILPSNAWVQFCCIMAAYVLALAGIKHAYQYNRNQVICLFFLGICLFEAFGFAVLMPQITDEISGCMLFAALCLLAAVAMFMGFLNNREPHHMRTMPVKTRS